MTSLPPLDFTKLESPPALDVTGDKFSHFSEQITVEVLTAKKTLNVHIEQVIPSNKKDPEHSVLFLHGQSFTSQTWIEIQSIFHVANWGWRAVAIDLPGYGQTKDTIHVQYDSEFLSSVITKLGLKRPIIVSPSMSGSFSLPFLFGHGVESLDRATAYVPVAPVSTSQFVKCYSESQLPTLIVYGTNDVRIGAISNKDLGHLPRGQYAPIEDAGHACYMNNPEAFHKYLYYFLNKL